MQDASGFREIVYPALEDDKADLIIDYTGSAATYLDETGTPSADPDETYDRLEEALGEKPIQALEYSPAEDKNALVALKSFADENSLTKISDLKAIEAEVVFGGSAQCLEREDCLLGYQNPDIYGLSFEDVKTLEYGPPLAAGLESDDLQAAQYQTTAAEIESGDFVVLEDDKGMLSADNIVPVIRTDIAEEFGDGPDRRDQRAVGCADHRGPDRLERPHRHRQGRPRRRRQGVAGVEGPARLGSEQMFV